MKAYIIADIEGVAGVEGFDIYGDRYPGEVAKKKRIVELWCAELNAAIDGALAAGAKEILVLDNHGSGDSLNAELLHPPAQLIHGLKRPTWLPLLDESVDVLLFVGQHAMAGTVNGHLCHTYSRKRLARVRLNGQDIGEIGIALGIAGTYGIPAVFISGDDKAVEEAKELVEGIESAVVKQGLSLHACLSLSCQEAQERIREGVAKGLARRGEYEPVLPDETMELVVNYRHVDFWRAPLRRFRHPLSGLKWHGLNGLKLVGNNLPALWDRFIGLA